jgi:SAM-dependent methyltransferase
VTSPSWSGYLDRFHRERPGITEATLARADAGGTNPYQWLLEPAPSTPRLLDLACGNGPVLERYPPAGWVGVDLAPAELALARRRGGVALVRAEAGRLPLAPGSFPAAVCSMAIMILPTLDTVLGEISRVLAPGGTAVLLLPGSWPLTARDLGRYQRLMLALRRTHLGYPNDRALTRLRTRAGAAGLRIVDDRRRRFVMPVRDAADGHLFVRSLYLPDVSDERVAAAAEVAARWAGSDIGVPLRRITLRRDPTGGLPVGGDPGPVRSQR